MKKLLYVLSSFVILLLSLLFFTPKIDNVFASEYNYNASVIEDYDMSYMEGIDSVESVSFDYNTYIAYRYEGLIPLNIEIHSTQTLSFLSTSSSYHFTNFILNLDRYNYINQSSDCLKYNIMLFGDFYLSSYDTSGSIKIYYIYGSCSLFLLTDMHIDYTLSDAFIPYATDDFFYSSKSYLTTDSNLNNYLDMDSETNFSYEFDDLVEDYSFGTAGDSILDYLELVTIPTTSHTMCRTGYLQDYNNNDLLPFQLGFRKGSSTKFNTIDTNLFYINFSTSYYSSPNNYTLTSYNVIKQVFVNDFTVIVNRPVHRTENTLVLYNYDYDCAIKSISSIEYCLSKNNDIYKAKYTGSLPNSRSIGIISDSLQNRLYDNYIYIYLTFSDNIVDFNGYNNFSLGFDFNFNRYYEPLVLDDIANDNTYYKPPLNDVDLFKPKTWIRYAVVWFFFYSPIVSDIFNYITPIVPILVRLIDWLLLLPLGEFILAYIGFRVFFKLFSSFVPSGSNAIINMTTNVVSAPSKIVNGIKNNKFKRMNEDIKKQKYKEYIKNKNLEKKSKKNK